MSPIMKRFLQWLKKQRTESSRKYSQQIANPAQEAQLVGRSASHSSSQRTWFKRKASRVISWGSTATAVSTNHETHTMTQISAPAASTNHHDLAVPALFHSCGPPSYALATEELPTYYDSQGRPRSPVPDYSFQSAMDLLDYFLGDTDDEEDEDEIDFNLDFHPGRNHRLPERFPPRDALHQVELNGPDEEVDEGIEERMPRRGALPFEGGNRYRNPPMAHIANWSSVPRNNNNGDDEDSEWEDIESSEIMVLSPSPVLNSFDFEQEREGEDLYQWGSEDFNRAISRATRDALDRARDEVLYPERRSGDRL